MNLLAVQKRIKYRLVLVPSLLQQLDETDLRRLNGMQKRLNALRRYISDLFAEVEAKAPFSVNNASARVSLTAGDILKILGRPLVSQNFTWFISELLNEFDHRLQEKFQLRV